MEKRKKRKKWKKKKCKKENSEYSIIIYKNSSCINELSVDMPSIDFGECKNK